MTEEKEWPTIIIRKGTQIERLIQHAGFLIPEDGLTFSSIPFQDIKWWNKWSNYDDKNGRKIVQRGCVFCFYLHLVAKIPFTKESLTNKVVVSFFEWLKESGMMNPRGCFEWNYAIEACVLEGLNMNLRSIEGWKKVSDLLKKIESFSGEPASVEAYDPLLLKAILIFHPEEGEALVEKVYMVGKFVSPVRLNFFDSMCFENMSHDREKKVICFHKDDTKTGRGIHVITDYSPNPRFSPYRLYTKYISAIGVKFRKGGFWRSYTPSKYKDTAGFYSPKKRWKMCNFTDVRKKMESLYLECFPADVLAEEISGRRLGPSARYSHLNTNIGLRRYGVKSGRKTYASANSTNPQLSDEQASRGYWKSVQVYRNSYMKGQSMAENWRQDRVMDHMMNLGGGRSSGNSEDMMRHLVTQNTTIIQYLVTGKFTDVLGKRKRDDEGVDLTQLDTLQPPMKKRNVDAEAAQVDASQVLVPSNYNQIFSTMLPSVEDEEEEEIPPQFLEMQQEDEQARIETAQVRSLLDLEFSDDQLESVSQQAEGHPDFGHYKVPVRDFDRRRREKRQDDEGEDEEEEVEGEDPSDDEEDVLELEDLPDFDGDF